MRDGADAAEEHAGATQKSGDVMDSVSGLAGALTGTMVALRQSFVETSDAATHYFDNAVQGNLSLLGIMRESAVTTQTQADNLQRLAELAASDVVGLEKYEYALALAQQETTDKIK